MDVSQWDQYSADQLRAVCQKQAVVIAGMEAELEAVKQGWELDEVSVEGVGVQFLEIAWTRQGGSDDARYSVDTATEKEVVALADSKRREVQKAEQDLENGKLYLTEEEKAGLRATAAVSRSEYRQHHTAANIIGLLRTQKMSADEARSAMVSHHEAQRTAILTELSTSIRRGVAYNMSTADTRSLCKVSPDPGYTKLMLFHETATYHSGARRAFSSARDVRKALQNEEIELSKSELQTLAAEVTTRSDELTEQVRVLENIDFHETQIEIIEDEVRRYHSLKSKLGMLVERHALLSFTLDLLAAISSGAVLDPATGPALSRLQQCRLDIQKMHTMLKHQKLSQADKLTVLSSVRAWGVLVDQCLLEARLSANQHAKEQQMHFGEAKEMTKTILELEARNAAVTKRVNGILREKEKEKRTVQKKTPRECAPLVQRPASAPVTKVRSPSPAKVGQKVLVNRLYTQAMQRIEERAKEERESEAQQLRSTRTYVGKEHIVDMNHRLYYAHKDKSKDMLKELHEKYYPIEGKKEVPPLTKNTMTEQVSKLYNTGIKVKQEKHSALFTKHILDKQHKTHRFANGEEEGATVTRLYQPKKS